MTDRKANDVVVGIKQLEHGTDLPLPERATPFSAGLDLLAAVSNDQILRPGNRTLVPTSIAIELPVGFEAQIRPRSGLAHKHGITVLNAPGTIDADYRGEVRVLLINLGDDDFIISRGMRIAQMVVAPVSRVIWETTQDLASSHRGEGGFGSTGTQTLTTSKTSTSTKTS
ncbi:MAG: dUTP diphosphatase [Magnetovibrio sp.]|nr:dUTP diphosphatase [Magnetovibrio sp.]